MRVKITHQYTGKPYVYIEIVAYNHNSYLHLPVNNSLHNSSRYYTKM